MSSVANDKMRIVQQFFRWLTLSALSVLLLGQIALALCFLAFGSIPLPADLTNYILNKANPGATKLHAESYHLKRFIGVEATALTVSREPFAEPLLSADSATVDLAFFKPNQSLISLDKVVLAGGTLYMPASLSADGERSPFLKKISILLRFQNDSLIVESFAAKHDAIKLRGRIQLPKSKGSINDKDKGPFAIEDFYQLARTIQHDVERFNIFTAPTLSFDIQVNETEGIRLATRLSSRSIQHPKINAHNFRLQTAFIYKDQRLIPTEPALLSVDRLWNPELSLSAKSVSAYISKENWNNLIKGEWPQFELAANAITHLGYSLDNTYIRCHPIDRTQILFSGQTAHNSSITSFSGILDGSTQLARILTHGELNILPSIPGSILQKMPEIALGKTPYIASEIELQLKDPLQINSAHARIQAEALSVNGIQFDHIVSEINYKDQLLKIVDTLIQRENQWLDFGFSLDFKNHDYGIRLVGSAVPYEYNAILPRWWEVIFRDFKFTPQTDSLGDFIIYGKTTNRVADLFFGHVYATNVSYADVPLTEGSLFVRGRERYVEIDRMNVHNEAERAFGKIAFSSLDDGIHQPVSIRYSISGAITPAHAQNIFGGSISKILKDFEMEQAPEINLEGVYFGDKYTDLALKSFFKIQASSHSPFSYKDILIDQLSINLISYPLRTALREMQFQFAGGQGFGEADIRTDGDARPELHFKLQLEGADKNLAEANLPIFQQEKTSTDTSVASAKFDLHLEATGPVDDPMQYTGHGQLRLEGRELGAIQLFGPLSRILQNTRLGFTSFILDEMDATFSLNKDLITFDSIAINGPQTRILADGTLHLPKLDLNMLVSINLIANIGDPDSGLRKIGSVINPFLRPLPNLLRFRLGGTLEDQQWRSQYDPRNLIELF